MDIEELHRRYFNRLCRYLVRKRADFETAEECANDALLSWFRTENKPAAEKLEAWLFKTAKNKYLDIVRKKRVLKTVALPEDFSDPCIIVRTSDSQQAEDEALAAVFDKYGTGYEDYILVGLECDFDKEAMRHNLRGDIPAGIRAVCAKISDQQHSGIWASSTFLASCREFTHSRIC